jgi:hypothetical protein
MNRRGFSHFGKVNAPSARPVANLLRDSRQKYGMDGFSDQSWLDDSGLPHTDAMRTIETFRRRDVGHMDVKITIDDPRAFTKPFSVDVSFNLTPNLDILESLCDNEKDVAHVGWQHA